MVPRFWNSEDGNYAAIFAIAILPIMAGVAGVVDYAGTSNDAASLQNTLDATALEVATKYHTGMSKTEAQNIGTPFFGANIYDASAASDFDAQVATVGGVTQVSATAKIHHPGMIGGLIWQATRSAVVSLVPGQPACLLALDPHAAASVKVQGSTQVKLNGCVVASNSDASDSVSRGGSAQLTAKCVTTVGGTAGFDSSNVQLDCPSALEKQFPSQDPLASITPPAYTACKNVPQGQKVKLSPGTYCNKAWSGDVTLDPGIYILRGGQIKLGGNGKLVGAGVTIFLMEGASFTSNANEVIQLSPSQIAPYAGITIFQDRDNTSALKVNGGVGSALTGFIYAPRADVFYAGNSTMTGAGDCIRIVGKTIEMTGNSAVSSNCDAALGGKKMNTGQHIVLVK
jgi:hypothetical protein